MGLGKNGKNGDRNDPARRRLSGDQFMARDQRVWAMRAKGYTIAEIADACGCGLATVDRALKRLMARRAELLDDELGAELDGVLARYAADSLSSGCADA